MKNLNKSIAFVIVVGYSLLSYSCSKEWFDEKSDKSLTVPNKIDDFIQLLDNLEVMSLQTPGLGELASDGHYTIESVWQTMIAQNFPVNSAQINAYTWSNNLLYEQVNDWNLPYHRIFNCNIVIDGLEKLNQEQNLSDYNQVKGNAIFHRAKNLYDLSQIYAEPYNPQADSKYGLQLVQSSDVTKITPRSSVHETYEFMVQELKSAVALLPLKPEIATRASKMSCWGLLSRIFLIMGKYDECKTYCDSVINNSNGLMNYEELSQNANPIAFLNKEVIFHSSMYEYQLTFSRRRCFVDSNLFNLYDSVDARKYVFFQHLPAGIVFVGSYNSSYSPVQFTGIALDEIYLNRAEAFVRLNKLDDAAGDLEILLQQRYLKKEDGTSHYTKPVFASQHDAFSVIYEERKKELLFRGLRWMDIRRHTIDMTFKEEITRTIGGSTYKLEPNSYKLTFPIPMDELTFSGIEQNPVW